MTLERNLTRCKFTIHNKSVAENVIVSARLCGKFTVAVDVLRRGKRGIEIISCGTAIPEIQRRRQSGD